MTETTNHEASPTGAGLIQFLDYAMKKGYLKTPTGSAMRTACREVLSAVEGEDWEAVDLLAIEVEDVLRRFETLRAMKFKSDSLSAYKSRFRKAVEMFAAFRADPSGWRPDLKERTRGGRAEPAARSSGARESEASEALTASPTATARLSSGASHGPMITYPFPLRDSVLASLQLPADLSRKEAKRLGAFIESLALDDVPALPPADTTGES